MQHSTSLFLVYSATENMVRTMLEGKWGTQQLSELCQFSSACCEGCFLKVRRQLYGRKNKSLSLDP